MAGTARIAALRQGNEVREARAVQRRALIGAPVEDVVRALLKPTPELSGYRLSALLAPVSRTRGPIPRLGRTRLQEALDELNRLYPRGRHWHEGLRLRVLSDRERQRLVEALLERAPKDWAKGYSMEEVA